MSTTTRRADRRALVDAGTRYHEAKLAYCYDYGDAAVANWAREERAFRESKDALLHAAECYVMGRRKASVLYGRKHAARTAKGKA